MRKTADGQVVYKIKGDNSEFKASVEESEKIAADGASKISKTNDTISTASKATLVGIGAAATAAGVKAIGLGKDFETSLTKASTLFGDVNVDMDTLSAGMLDLSDSTGLAADSLGEALYNALSAGVPATEDMSDALSYLEGSAKLAKAGFTDIDTASSATIKTLNAYGMGIEEADRVQKVLMQTQNKGITTVGELGGVLAQVTPTAAAMNVSFEQVGASLALMTAKGTSTAQASTQLNSLLAELGKNGTTADKNFRKAAEGTKLAGLSFTEAMDQGYTLADVLEIMGDYADDSGLSMLDMFSSIEAGKAALSISGDISTFNDNLGEMGTELDVVGEAADKMASTTDDQLNVAMNQLSNILISLYQNVLQPLVIWFAEALNWIGEHKEMIIAITIVIAALAAGLAIYTAAQTAAAAGTTLLATATGALSAVMAALTSPITLIIVAIGALIAAGYLLIKHWDEVKEFCVELWESVKEFFIETFEAIKAFLLETWESIKQFFVDTWNAIKELAISVWDAIKTFFIDTWNTIKSTATEIWSAIKNFFSDIWNGIKTTFQNAIDNIKSNFQSFKDTIKKIWDDIKLVFEGIINFIKGAFTGNWKQAWDGIKQIFSGIAEGIKDIFRGAINFLIDKLNNFISGANNIKIPDWVPVIGGKSLNIPLIPRLKVGMDYVPNDNFPAFLHKGEAVLTAEQASLWRSLGRETGILSKLLNGGGNSSTSFTIAKLADSITVRSDEDISAISESLYQRIVNEKRSRGLR